MPASNLLCKESSSYPSNVPPTQKSSSRVVSTIMRPRKDAILQHLALLEDATRATLDQDRSAWEHELEEKDIYIQQLEDRPKEKDQLLRDLESDLAQRTHSDSGGSRSETSVQSAAEPAMIRRLLPRPIRDDPPAPASSSRSLKRSYYAIEEPQPSMSSVSPMTVHGVSTNRRLPRDPSPLNRAAALAGFPMLIVDLPEAITAPVPFTREALENILGGRPTRSQNHAVKTFGNETPLAADYQIEQYLVLPVELHAWLPTVPGEHGYIFPRTRLQDALALLDTPRHTFVAVGEKIFYYGQYQVHPELLTKVTRGEWAGLSRKFKIDLLKKISHDPLNRLLAEYNAGSIYLPCMPIECVDFNDKFCRKLVCENVAFLTEQRRLSGKSAKCARAVSPDV